MGTFAIGGTAKDRGTARIDPRLVDIIQRTAASSPYNVQLFSGIRPGDRRYHGRGYAVDIVLSDPATGQEIPNLKSAVGFPIYEEFAKAAREVQQEVYPDLADSFRWGGYFSGGKGKYGAVDLMHFDLGPTAKMAGGSWETGLTPEQAKIVANMGEGQIYSGEGQRKAGPGEYANLWGREPLQSQQTMQADPTVANLQQYLIANGFDPGPPNGVMSPQTLAAIDSFNASVNQMSAPQTAYADAIDRMDTEAPAQQAIDDMLTGQSADQVLAGGPRINPRRAGPTPGPIAPEAGSFARTAADVLDAGPNLRPDLPAAFRPGPGGAVGQDLGTMAAGMPLPPDRPGGAPDAGLVPNPPEMPGGAPDASVVPIPPSRASGIPDPTMRPDINDPSLSFNRQSGRGPDMREALADQLDTMVAGREEFPGSLPAASRTGDLSAAMGDVPDPLAGIEERQDAFQGAQESRFLARELGRNRSMMEDLTTVVSEPEPPLGDRSNIGARFDDAFSSPSFDMGRFDDAFAPTTSTTDRVLSILNAPDTTGIDQYRPNNRQALTAALLDQEPYADQRMGGSQALNDLHRAIVESQNLSPTPDIEPSVAFNPPDDATYRWFHGFDRNYTGQGGAFGELPPSAANVVGGPSDQAADIGTYNSGAFATAPSEDIISRGQGWWEPAPEPEYAGIPQGDADQVPSTVNAANLAQADILDAGDLGLGVAAAALAQPGRGPDMRGIPPPIQAPIVVSSDQPMVLNQYGQQTAAGGDRPIHSGGDLQITAPAPATPSGGSAPIMVQAPQLGGGRLNGGSGGLFGIGANWAGPQWTGPITQGSGDYMFGDQLGNNDWWSGETNALGGSTALTWTNSDGRTVTAYTNDGGRTYTHGYG